MSALPPVPKVRFKPTGMEHEYRVLEGEQVIGRVRKKMEFFNLRRPVTVSTWVAFTASDERLRPLYSSSGYRTRAEAVEALQEHARLSA